jgi:hypothetical protein
MAAERAGILFGSPPATVLMICADAGTAKIIAKHMKHSVIKLRMILNMIRPPLQRNET